MFGNHDQLKAKLREIVHDKARQGHVVEDLETQINALPASYDAIADFARKLSDLPLRSDWLYVEPDEWDDIESELDPRRPQSTLGALNIEDLSKRVEAAFLGSVCGCVLGKPLEINPTLDELKAAFESTNDWPLTDYVSEQSLKHLRARHGSWPNTTRGNIQFVEPDDDMNYTIMGMLVLEKYGIAWTKQNLRDLWLHHLTLGTTWGPERTVLARAAWQHFLREGAVEDVASWARTFNPGDELCGAQIRADGYGYGAAGRPQLAAEWGWRDGSFTHRRTGTYATMWTAAAIAAAPVAKNALQIFEIANQFVPQRSRFFKIVSDALHEVEQSSDWLDGYRRINGKYGEYSHCRVYQESGTLINTLRWAESVGHGIGLQVMQGNDTDSYGATAGSILGAFFGPGHLEERWIAPFNDDIHTALAWFYERSLLKLAARMGQLPVKVASKLGT